MLLWFKSKLVMIVAGLILVSAIAGFFYFYVGNINTERMENNCQHVADVVNTVYTTDSYEAGQDIIFGEADNPDEGSISLPEDISREPYELIFYRDMVAMEIEDETRAAEFGMEVHLWDPEKRERSDILPEEEVESMDEDYDGFSVSSDEDNIIHVRKLRICDGSEEVDRVFVFEGGSR